MVEENKMVEDDFDSKNSGKFVTRNLTRPPVEIDCSGWGGVEPASEGQFVTHNDIRPAIEIDCSNWAPAKPVAMVLSLQIDPSTDWMGPTSAVIRRLDEAEQALEGGAGLVWDRIRSAPVGQGKVILTLTPLNRDGAEARLTQLVEWAKGAIPECVGARLAA
jgi:hypothetical protein